MSPRIWILSMQLRKFSKVRSQLNSPLDWLSEMQFQLEIIMIFVFWECVSSSLPAACGWILWVSRWKHLKSPISSCFSRSIDLWNHVSAHSDSRAENSQYQGNESDTKIRIYNTYIHTLGQCVPAAGLWACSHSTWPPSCNCTMEVCMLVSLVGVFWCI